ncbi:nicotinate phosphoribosyltransferase [Microbotryum lychnidis-dioicae p1A1 Lamole]|uniref:Nicotinate phosphoribosyltransferase n=1 Tax=Microbotryum lychnidis-dioicae (strain p1A1 Lamole / MvSl-1064) TaxID=683840 RepID=U5H0T0_USTV1|nr:nicotinate phosphoribosyltransferase [Microbotryum lychnidis-dioicae p1A1 Lamole]|eukprot:KDE08907.1 nicotinate phosphoribosyltransferase [Microbotryum lychnidis-dioicae p1A1 Lamole]
MLIQSLLDTDLYKLSLQNAVRHHFPQAQVEYRFTNRGRTPFTRRMHDAVLVSIKDLRTLRLTSSEAEWLKTNCPYFTPEYLDYLSEFRFDPDQQVKVDFVVENTDEKGVESGRFEIEIKGGWAATILYEVPVMAILSEVYFAEVDTAWDYMGQFEQAKEKGRRLFLGGCLTSEFGTRRRRSFKAQEIIIRGLLAAHEEYASGEGRGKLSGTSNIFLAMKYGLMPIGTIAHEWIMGIAALHGYEKSNALAMRIWDECYPSKALSVALTDTFSTKPFFDDFVADPERSRTWRGLRQDSGDPLDFIPMAKEAFLRVGADPKTKVIVFSDGLDVPTCLKLKKASDVAGVGCSFGVGTNLTNDFRRTASPIAPAEDDGSGPVREQGEKSKALNMVIKMYRINDKFCIKISDDLTKNTGDAAEVERAKQILHLGKPQVQDAQVP